MTIVFETLTLKWSRHRWNAVCCSITWLLPLFHNLDPCNRGPSPIMFFDLALELLAVRSADVCSVNAIGALLPPSLNWTINTAKRNKCSSHVNRSSDNHLSHIGRSRMIERHVFSEYVNSLWRNSSQSPVVHRHTRTESNTLIMLENFQVSSNFRLMV